MTPADLLRARLAPADPLESAYADQILGAFRELDHLRAIQTEVLDASWATRFARAQSIFIKAHAALEKLRKASLPPTALLGFAPEPGPRPAQAPAPDPSPRPDLLRPSIPAPGAASRREFSDRKHRPDPAARRRDEDVRRNLVLSALAQPPAYVHVSAARPNLRDHSASTAGTARSPARAGSGHTPGSPPAASPS